MRKIIINVYKNDNSYIKSPSLLQFEVEEKENWRQEVENTLLSILTQPRENYILSYQYSYLKDKS